jgi:hypothetical protein
VTSSGHRNGAPPDPVGSELHVSVRTRPGEPAAGAAYRLSDVELASRLSFFLWSSIPDEALLKAAEGTLKQPRR